MRARSQHDRRSDKLTAARFDLAILAARAFDVAAGQNYLLLSGVSTSIARRFAERYPNGVRTISTSTKPDRRRQTVP
jgi:hypothetical protein